MEGNERRTSATAGDKGAAAYERQKRRAAERSRRTSLAGREIAPLPPIFNARRRAACKYDLALFLRTYLPKKFKKSFSRNHLRYIRTLQDAIINGGLRAIAMPRGAGKTTIVKGAVVWAILYGWHKYVLVVSATKTEATELLADVKKSFVSERIREDFPEVAVPLARLGGSALLARGQLFEGEATGIVWQTDKIKTPTIPGSAASAATIRAVGINGAIRGASTDGVDGETARPSLVVCDDLQKIEDAKNPERVKKICDKIERDIIGLAADGDSMTVVMVCTCIEPDDVSAIYLSPETRPQWNGLRFKMVERFPDRLDDLWLREYATRRRKSAKEANAFYAEHREAMDAGAVVDWPENYDRKKEASRLQRAMNYLIDDEASFWSERQNEPRAPETASLVCDARTIRSRTNGLERFQVPNDATTLTAFIDVHADVLYYAVCAFKDDRTCFVVDYGAFPEQREEYFFKGRSGNATLKQTFAFADVDGGIQEGVFSLIHQILGETWLSVSGHVLSISRLMVDVGYRRDPVESAIRRVGVPVVSPAKGRAIGATRKPMSEWTPKPGAKVGNRWIAEPTPGRAFKTITTDVNFFKSEVHAAFAAPVGSVAGASLWGSVEERHRMFADHCCAERCQLAKAAGNEVAEWTAIPGRDNHLFDCVVGCFAGAAVQGLRKPGERPTRRREKEDE